MLHTILTSTTSHSVNWFLIIGLSILIALPLIASSIIIPILLAIHKRQNKLIQNHGSKSSYKKTRKRRTRK
ncbi:MAG: hypothetical protein LBF36_00230 [Mycoplasmataceae bacterium]|nr:hypothetical protein [Mycoplasmataceae bacterium]